MSTDAESLTATDDLIEQLKDLGHGDYSAHRLSIATKLFEKGIWDGNYDSKIFFEDGLPGLRLIQEDEYDQSMDEEDKPDWDSMLCSVNGGYLWAAEP